MNVLRLKTLLVFLVLLSGPALSQSLPSCRALASDADGDGYGWENDASCVVTGTSLSSPQFTNLETGESVDLVRAQWDAGDIAGKSVVCADYHFDGESYLYEGGVGYLFRPLSSTAPYNGNVIIGFGQFATTQTWTIDNGIYYGPSGLSSSPWVEIIDHERFNGSAIDTQDAVRVWYSNERFLSCFTPNPATTFVPSRVSNQSNASDSATPAGNDGCDYSNAAIYDGWGWNPDTGTSCEPVTVSSADNCDYSNATINDGWGWNARNGQSCAPLDSGDVPAVDQSCDYTRADSNQGWGWNPTTRSSCPPL